MEDELTNEDWKQIALFYQNKYNELELKILALELKLMKAQAAEASAEDSED